MDPSLLLESFKDDGTADLPARQTANELHSFTQNAKHVQTGYHIFQSPQYIDVLAALSSLNLI